MEEEKSEILKEAKVGFTEGLKESIREASQSIGRKRLDENKKGLLDVVQEKLASRKLLVFITSTVLMWYGLDPETWGLIAMCYIGGQSAIDMVNVWKWGK